MRKLASIAALVFAATLSASSALAQSPRQIRFIVPFPAGGVKASSLPSCDLSASRKPQGEYGVASVFKPALLSSF